MIARAFGAIYVFAVLVAMAGSVRLIWAAVSWAVWG
jgi:hypothetical protein